MLILRQGNSALAQKCSSFEALREKMLKGKEAATACFMSTCFSTSYRVCRETKCTEQRCGAETERTATSGWEPYESERLDARGQMATPGCCLHILTKACTVNRGFPTGGNLPPGGHLAVPRDISGCSI